MDQWAWTREMAVKYMGITMACGGIIGGMCFASIGPLAKRIDERKLLIICGFIPLIIGKLVYFPMGKEHPQMYGNFTVGGKLYFKVLQSPNAFDL